MPQLSSAESIFRIWDYSYLYFYYSYGASNALCEFKFQFSEQKPLAHKNINFCPTSTEGKIQSRNRTVPKRAQLRISGAMCVRLCELNQDKGAKTMMAGATLFWAYFNVTLLCFSNFSRVLRCAFPRRFAPTTVFILKQFISIEM